MADNVEIENIDEPIMNFRIKNLIGQKFGKLTVVKFIGQNKRGGAIWECICECNNVNIASSDHLTHGNVKRCDFCSKTEDITGNIYGRLTVIKYVKENSKWLCKCECDNDKLVGYHDLVNGKVKSCGCLKSDTKNNETHGLSNTRLYTIYCGMKQRCYDENSTHYNIYGGKGIIICDEWLEDFVNFYNWAMNNGYSDNLTIDRIDANKNYEPSNCRWADYESQANNTNRNVFITHNGETKTMIQWSRELGINYSTLRSYYQKYGLDNMSEYINNKLGGN